VQGVGTLFPWNCFLTAYDYFNDRFKGSHFSNDFMNLFLAAYQAVNMCATAARCSQLHRADRWPCARVQLVSALRAEVSAPLHRMGPHLGAVCRADDSVRGHGCHGEGAGTPARAGSRAIRTRRWT
jgi:hypothetical protein